MTNLTLLRALTDASAATHHAYKVARDAGRADVAGELERMGGVIAKAIGMVVVDRRESEVAS